jgi:dTMP kinase
MKGMFITFEGSEGCGKSTQSRLLYKYLKNKGYPVIYLREPGANPISERIREILLDPKNHITPECEMLLYMASRAQIVRGIIKPALLKGKMVICDRFLDSTIAYQGYGLGMNVAFIKALGNFVTAGIKPNLTVFLDLPVKAGLKHRHILKDRIERRSLAYHMRVRKGYLKLVSQEPKRIKIIKLDKDINVTQGKIRKLVEKYVIQRYKRPR